MAASGQGYYLAGVGYEAYVGLLHLKGLTAKEHMGCLLVAWVSAAAMR